jgi:hypothetical protein
MRRKPSGDMNNVVLRTPRHRGLTFSANPRPSASGYTKVAFVRVQCGGIFGRTVSRFREGCFCPSDIPSSVFFLLAKNDDSFVCFDLFIPSALRLPTVLHAPQLLCHLFYSSKVFNLFVHCEL